MTIRAFHRGSHVAPTQAVSGLSRLAFGLALVVLAGTAVAVAIFAIAYGIGGADATSDNWVGVIGVLGLVLGLGGSVSAFGLAVAARLGHDHSGRLWLPLVLFPALLAFVVLGEAFWWE